MTTFPICFFPELATTPIEKALGRKAWRLFTAGAHASPKLLLGELLRRVPHVESEPKIRTWSTQFELAFLGKEDGKTAHKSRRLLS